MNSLKTICLQFFMLAAIFVASHLHCNPVYSQNNYQYDEQGRLVADLSASIKEIKWNNKNLIAQVTRVDTSRLADLEFQYNSHGKRISKCVKPRNGSGLLPQTEWHCTHYVYSEKGELLATYTDRFSSKGEANYLESLEIQDLSIVASDGRIGVSNERQLYSTSEFSAEIDEENGEFFNRSETAVLEAGIVDSEHLVIGKGNSRYELRAHSEDIHAVVTDRKIKDEEFGNIGEVTTAIDYYAYGMVRPSRLYEVETYRYGMGAKERDDEIKGEANQYDFGARPYDPRIGRWLTTDPAFASYPDISAYHYSRNSPVMYNDPDGKNAKLTVIPKKGGGGTIVVSSEFVLDSEDNEILLTNIQTILNQYYKPGSYVDDKTGARWDVTFDFKFYTLLSYLPKMKKLQPHHKMKEMTRGGVSLLYVYQAPKDKEAPRGHMLSMYMDDDLLWDGIYDAFDYTDDVFTILHEVGHHLGLSDRYIEKDKELKINNEKHTRATRKDDTSGRTNDELMGGYNPKSFRIDQVHYDNWAKYALSKNPTPGKRKKYSVIVDSRHGYFVDIKDGKLTGPYVNIEYERNKRAYWSAHESLKHQKRIKKK